MSLSFILHLLSPGLIVNNSVRGGEIFKSKANVLLTRPSTPEETATPKVIFYFL